MTYRNTTQVKNNVKLFQSFMNHMMLNSSHFEGNFHPKLLFLSGSPQGSMTFHAADKCVLKNIAVGRRWISLNGFTIWISLPEFSHQPTDGSQIQTSRQVIHMQKQDIRNRQSKY